MVEKHLESGALRQVLAGWQADTLPLHVVFPPNRHISNKVRVFVDWVAERLAMAGLTQRRADGV
jgi:DNA-binding transcriptional LysR family regulator